MRQGELLWLTWPAVDFERSTVHIYQQLQRDRDTRQYVMITPKNSKGRILAPAPFVMGILREYRRLQTEWKLKSGGAWADDWGLVFTNEIEQNYFPSSLSHTYKNIAKSIRQPGQYPTI